MLVRGSYVARRWLVRAVDIFGGVLRGFVFRLCEDQTQRCGQDNLSLRVTSLMADGIPPLPPVFRLLFVSVFHLMLFSAPLYSLSLSLPLSLS